MRNEWGVYGNYYAIASVVQGNYSIGGGNLRNVGSKAHCHLCPLGAGFTHYTLDNFFLRDQL